ncbi:molybdopterin-guanine dinucleotide biosynthesis protein B [Nosocomiicoccus massiliensis]|uniref:molybdopterin-guanine dinucleotide biosynthesis protein B n=1 Tax=Nosocomiicoccus massiliensis TaxID=1232430 RepID=UPI0004191A61|nr:molybdopterin-guanine dinucleotide biosynthesis protein B [Nosocomiicoccus massiliensis]
MKILQVVGYKDTGKTMLIVEFLKILKDSNLKAAVIKHHHIDIDESTDTGKFSRLSDYTILNTPNYTIYHDNKVPDLEEQIEALNGKVDVVLVEGYKSKDYDKIVLTHSFTGEKGDIRDLELSNVVNYYNVASDQDAILQWFKGWSKNR